MMRRVRSLLVLLVGFGVLFGSLFHQAVRSEVSELEPPAVGTRAPDFVLPALPEGEVGLIQLTEQGPVVLVVLRGYPGYQCPICTRQVAELRAQAEAIASADARVVLIYPGPSEQLQKRAEEFLGETALPENFSMLIDPDYTFTNAYHLRWDAPRETAYPSTFVIDTDGTVRFARISKTHGGRVPASQVVEALAALNASR